MPSRSRSRSRSRSPYFHDQSPRHSTDRVRQRSRTPRRHDHRHRHRHTVDSNRPKKQRHEQNVGVDLPLGASTLSKNQLRVYRPMFALYLDIQKSLYIEDLTEDEVRGRWKSFLGKWNRGELAEGWYDPATLQKAITAELEAQNTEDHRYEQSRSEPHGNVKQASSAPYEAKSVNKDADYRPIDDVWKHGQEEDTDDDDFGPSLPNAVAQGLSSARSQGTSRAGPLIPTIDDVRARHEQDREDAALAKESQIADLRAERKADRHLQKERLDDLAPRAEAGSRERMLENKKLAAESNRAFAASAHAGGEIELRDSEVMGDEDSLADLKRMKKENERKKNERELRREEIMRARIAEREDRVRGLREKENKTMNMLKKIAQARFGSGEAGPDHG